MHLTDVIGVDVGKLETDASSYIYLNPNSLRSCFPIRIRLEVILCLTYADSLDVVELFWKLFFFEAHTPSTTTIKRNATHEAISMFRF